jgi:hypothetical protein
VKEPGLQADLPSVWLPLAPSLLRRSTEDDGKRSSLTMAQIQGQGCDCERRSWSGEVEPNNFTIFEGTSEIQRMLIGRAVTGLDVR